MIAFFIFIFSVFAEMPPQEDLINDSITVKEKRRDYQVIQIYVDQYCIRLLKRSEL